MRIPDSRPWPLRVDKDELEALDFRGVLCPGRLGWTAADADAAADVPWWHFLTRLLAFDVAPFAPARLSDDDDDDDDDDRHFCRARLLAAGAEESELELEQLNVTEFFTISKRRPPIDRMIAAGSLEFGCRLAGARGVSSFQVHSKAGWKGPADEQQGSEKKRKKHDVLT